jgi:ABC-2 type transport system ATP-binding protein
MIELEQLTKRYGRRGSGPDALSDLTLSVPRGAVWAVVGPNGAGKSTLLALLLGFIRPTSGSVELDGMPPREFLRSRGAAYLPERFSVPFEWRVRDALRLFARLDRAPELAADISARLGLDDHADKAVGELSRGLLQRLGLAQALIEPRELVVLDEPTEGLDPLWRIRLRDIIASLAAGGSTVIIASHDLGEVERVAGRAVLLDGGRVRDVLEIGRPPAGAVFDITLAAPCERAAEAFPGADPGGTVNADAGSAVGADTGAAAGAHTLRVQVANALELNERLAALIALGGVVTSVTPVHDALEDRVRAALEHDA